MCRRSSCYKSLRIFLWFTVVATPITGEQKTTGDKLLLRLGKWKEKWDKDIPTICVFPLHASFKNL